MLRVDFNYRVIFTCVSTHVDFTQANKIGVMYDRLSINVKGERGSTFVFKRHLAYIASVSFTRVKFTYVCRLKLRNSGSTFCGKVKQLDKLMSS